jgi:outer membrane biosynthesis protein TonB
VKSLRLTVAFVALGLFLSVRVADGAKRSSQTEQQPAVVSAVAPYFPAVALAARVANRDGGKVVVEVKIDAKGVVTSAEAVSGHRLLQGVSIMAAKRWHFAESAEPKNIRTARLTFIFIQLNDKPPRGEPSELVTFMPPYQVEVKKYVELVETTSH